MEHTPQLESVIPCSDEQISSPAAPTQKHRFLTPLLSFGIPFALMLLAFAFAGVIPFGIFSGNPDKPFGDEQILNFDLWHQYYPFLQIFQEKLQEGGSMLYTWVVGMGTNFVSMVAYYIASPLNLLTLLLPAEWLREALTFGVLIKVGLAGLFFSFFAKKVFKRSDSLVILVSSLYGLCNYATGYYWNVMWLDLLAIFPLVMLGAYELFTHSKFKLYTVTIGLSLLMNYYVGYMVCVFVAITFFAYAILYKVGWKTFLKKLGLFGLFSLLGCMLSAVLTLPSFLALQSAAGSSGSFGGTLSFYRGFEDLFASLLSFHNPTSIDGLPNIGVGLVCVVLTFVFFLNTKFSLREKLVALGVLLILIFSLNLNLLDFIWHGFHYPNQVPHRFGFILSFCLAALALRALSKTDEMDKWDIVGTSIFALLFTACSAIAILREDSPVFAGEKEVLDSKVILLLNIGLAAFYLILLYLKQKKYIRKEGFTILLCFVMLMEVLPASLLGVKAVGTTSHSGYTYKHDTVHSIVEYAENLNKDSITFYRMDFTDNWSCNDSALYGYNGISQFSSAANSKVTTFLHNMGLAGDEASNRYTYKQNTPIANAFLNLKYLMHNNINLKDQNYLQKITQHGSIHLYENTAYLPLGFMTDSSVTQLELDAIEVFQTQNDLFTLAAGLDSDALVDLPLTDGEHKNLTVRPVDRGQDGGYADNYNYLYEAAPNSTELDLEMTATASATGSLYGYLTIPGAIDAQIYLDGKWELDSDLEDNRVEQHAVYLGEVKEGDSIRVTAKIDSVYTSGYCNLQLAVLDHTVFEEGMNRMKDETLELTEFSDTTVKGVVNALSDGILYTSIPNEKGWSVKVDGQSVETVSIGGAMLGIPMSAGVHNVELQYSPNGFMPGLWISIAAVVILVAISLLQRKFRFIPCDSLTLPLPAEKKAKEPLPASEEPVKILEEDGEEQELSSSLEETKQESESISEEKSEEEAAAAPEETEQKPVATEPPAENEKKD